MQIAKKISVGGINGVRNGFKNVAQTTLVARILGVAYSFEHKDTNFGKSLSFHGEFRAVNADGEEVAAPVCYLVSPADTMLAQALTEAKGSSVEFGFDIFVSPKEKRDERDLGYEYKVKPLLEATVSDPLAKIMARVQPLQLGHSEPDAETKKSESAKAGTEHASASHASKKRASK